MSQHIDKIDVSVSGIGGLKAQGFELNVAVNSIPSITIEALPVSQSGGGTKASTANYASLTSVYKSLAEKAANLSTTGTISISIKPSSGGCKAQNITLSGWILSDVGLSSVTNYSAPTLTVVFKHPIVKLDHYGAIYEVIKNRQQYNKELLNIGGNSVIGIMDAIYTKYAGGSIKFFDVASTAHGGPDGSARGIVTSLRSGLSSNKPSTYLTSTGGMFLGSSGASAPFIKAAIASLVAPKPFGSSTWITLLQTVCAQMMACIVPTYNSKTLKIEPYNPWQTCSLSLDGSRIESIDTASMDEDPIFGVAIQKSADSTEVVTGGATRACIPTSSNPENATFAFYFPKKLNLSNTYGRIEFYGGNDIVAIARNLDFGCYNTGGNLTGSSNKISDQEEEKLLGKIAEAVFIGKYKKTCKAAIVAIPTFFDSGGSLIYPGRVMTAKDNNGGELFHGFLTKMTVSGSSNGGGSAYYELSSTRSPSSSASQLLDEGVKNPCYS